MHSLQRFLDAQAPVYAAVAPEEPLYAQVLQHLCGSRPDARTLALLQPAP